MWVLDYLEDLESDFSVFHRVEDYTLLDGPRFFRMATRLPAYRGVMRERVIAEHEAKRPPTPTAGIGSSARANGSASSSGVGWQSMSLEQADGRLGDRREVHRG